MKFLFANRKTDTPAEITADQNDYPTGNAGYMRISSDAARNITGLAGGVPGRPLIITNIGSFGITLVAASASSLAANRIVTGVGNVLIAVSTGVSLIYDGVSSRWRTI